MSPSSLPDLLELSIINDLLFDIFEQPPGQCNSGDHLIEIPETLKQVGLDLQNTKEKIVLQITPYAEKRLQCKLLSR